MPFLDLAAKPHQLLTCLIWLMPALAVAVGLTASMARADVTLKHGADGWTLMRDGQPFVVRGVGRPTSLEMAVDCGVNTIRSYGHKYMHRDEVAGEHRQLLDKLHENGMAVIQGLYIPKDRPNNNSFYDDPKKLTTLRYKVRTAVEQLRDHPAVLVWVLGNEAEGSRTKELHPAYWQEVGRLAEIVHEADPTRPVMYVMAGTSAWKVGALKKYAPGVDIVGCNTYNSAKRLPRHMDKAEWDGPYMLTEFGPPGHWEVPKTDWGAPIEANTVAKYQNYLDGFRGAMNDPKGRCLGGVCFVWAQKQEITATWYGMFLASGEKLPTVDAIAQLYQNSPPPNRSPFITEFDSKLALAKVDPGQTYEASVTVEDAENDPLTYEWRVIREYGKEWNEGGYEEAPEELAACVISQKDNTVVVRTPPQPGAYRLFVFVRDGQGGAAAENRPFFVNDLNQ